MLYGIQCDDYDMSVSDLLAVEDTGEEVRFEDIDSTTVADKYISLDEKKEVTMEYIIATSSGVLAGLLDIFWVGDFSLNRAIDWGKGNTNEFVMNVAKVKGYKGNNLCEAIRHLEDKYPFSGDSAMQELGGSRQHHFRDFTHHPSPIGLMFSIYSQFSGVAVGTDTAGNMISASVDVVKSGEKGFKFGEALFNGTINWFFHLVSDMAGSNQTAGAGCGIPGPVLSMAKEISALPMFKNAVDDDGKRSLSKLLAKLYNGTLLADHDASGKIIPGTERRIDFRTELGIAHELGRQMIPVIVNECVVRAFYFIRHFCLEIKRNQIQSWDELDRIQWKEVIPFGNPKIARLMSISSGAFMMMDLSHAAVSSAIASAGESSDAKDYAGKFGINMLLKINYAGVGRFAIALGADLYLSNRKDLDEETQAQIYESMQQKVGNNFLLTVSDKIQTSDAKEGLKAIGMIGPMVAVFTNATPLAVISLTMSLCKMMADAEKEYKEAKENRIATELECEEAIARIREYRALMKEEVDQYFTEKTEAITEGFDLIDAALSNNNPDMFLQGNAVIQELLGHEVQFRTQQEFDDLMLSDTAFQF